MIDALFSELTVWHWLGLAFVLLAIEMTIGTFDLLWMAIAAGATALFASLIPDSDIAWAWEFGFFASTAFILILMGRKFFSGRSDPPETHPTLNNRNASLIGLRAVATIDFQDGVGRVKINDSEWRAQIDNGVYVLEGDPVVVVAAKGSTVTVRAV
jgi:membrane protein implicated in regulation of membrane protease activity